jgi:hypothetical protein
MIYQMNLQPLSKTALLMKLSLFYRIMLVILLLLLSKQVLALLLQIMLSKKTWQVSQGVHGPTKLGYVWEPRIYVTIGKNTRHAIVDLGSSVCAIPKYLCDPLDLPPDACKMHPWSL